MCALTMEKAVIFVTTSTEKSVEGVHGLVPVH